MEHKGKDSAGSPKHYLIFLKLGMKGLRNFRFSFVLLIAVIFSYVNCKRNLTS